MKKFCVIHPRQTGNGGKPCQRKWCDTEDEAIEHAGELLRAKQEASSKDISRKLYVVEVKRVVELAPRPLMTRELREDDLPKQEAPEADAPRKTSGRAQLPSEDEEYIEY